MTPYQFAIIRYLHNANSGEFVNIGLVMWLPREKRTLFSINERYSRLSQFFSPFDGSGYRQLVRQLSHRLKWVSKDIEERGSTTEAEKPILDIGDLLPLLLPEDNSCFQWSSAMAGIASDPELRLKQLTAEMIERHEPKGPRTRRDEADIWGGLEQRLQTRGLTGKLQRDVELSGANYSYKFKRGWKNGAIQVLEPISLDYLYPWDVIDKATTWSGRLFNLSKSTKFEMSGVLARPQGEELTKAYNQAVAILKDTPQVRALITEDEFDDFMNKIEHDLEHDT